MTAEWTLITVPSALVKRHTKSPEFVHHFGAHDTCPNRVLVAQVVATFTVSKHARTTIFRHVTERGTNTALRRNCVRTRWELTLDRTATFKPASANCRGSTHARTTCTNNHRVETTRRDWVDLIAKSVEVTLHLPQNLCGINQHKRPTTQSWRPVKSNAVRQNA